MYQNYFQNAFSPYIPKTEVVKVNGRNGADAYQLSPNSSILLLDENQPLVYLKTTDGAGYATVSVYSIVPYAEPKPIDVSDLAERLSRLEGIVNESYIAKHERSTNEVDSVNGKGSTKSSSYDRSDAQK